MSWRIARLSSFARRWWGVGLAPLVGAPLAFAYGSRVAPVYEAQAKLVVSAPVGGQNLNSVAAQVPTYGELVNDIPLLQGALRTLRLPLTPQELQPNVRGEADASTRTLTIRVRNRNPRIAAALANTLARDLIRWVAAAAPTRPGSHVRPATPRFTILQSASGAVRIRPRVVLIAGFGGLAGLFGGLAIAVLATTIGRTVRGEDELARIAPIPVFGSVNGGFVRAADGRTLLGAAVGESYRRLSTWILSASTARSPRSLLVVGAQGNEGSAAVAAKLALALAGTMGSVSLTDLASERPIAHLLGIGEKSASAFAKGSSPLRHGPLTLDRFALRGGPPLVVVFPRERDAWSAGPEEIRAVLADLLAEADFVILHAASLGSAPAALVWARMLDAVVLVVRARHTRRQSVVSAVHAFSLAGAHVAGAVLSTGES